MKFGLNFGLLGSGKGGGGGFIPGTVPKVRSSKIINAGKDGILIAWDRPMVFSPSLKDAITVIVNGTTIAAKNIEANPTDPKQLVIIMNTPFTKTDVVTWAYNDQHATEFLKGAEVGGVKADNQTYAVDNQIADVFDVVTSTIYDNNHNRILVKMNEAAKDTGPDVRFQVAITVNGGQPIVPNAVVTNGDFLTFSDSFNFGDVITWQYSTGQEKITSLADKELDTLVHTVDNQIVAPTSNDWIDESSNNWVDENTNNWSTV